MVGRCTWSRIAMLQLQLLCIMQGTWQKEALTSANKKIELPRYFKTDTDSEVLLILSNILKLINPDVSVAYIDDVIIVNSEYAYEITLHWNWTTILIKHSSSMNYTNKYTVELKMFYMLNCFSSIKESVNIIVKLRPLDILLAPAGELHVAEGQPLKLTCTVFGHIPKNNNKVKIHYWSSGEPIANCSSDTTELPNSDINYDVLTSTCELSAHSTQSNSGNYSCSASIEDMVVSSGEVHVVVNVESRNVEPRKDLKTIIGATVGSSAGLIMVSLTTCIVIIYVRRKCYRNQADLEHEPLMHEGVVVPRFNHGVDDHQRIEANLDQGQGGRDSPANSDRSSRPGDHSLIFSDQGGYETII